MLSRRSSLCSVLRPARGPLAALAAVTIVALLGAGCADTDPRETDPREAEPVGDVEQALPPGELPPEEPSPDDLGWIETAPSAGSAPVYVVHGGEGVANAPIPSWVQSEIADDLSEPTPEDEDATYVVMDGQFLADLYTAMSTGQYTEQLMQAQEAYEEQEQQEQQQLPLSNTSQLAAGSAGILDVCSKKTYTRTKDLSRSFLVSGNPSPTSGASLTMTGDVSGSITGEVKYKVKRCLGIPYWVKLVHARVHGTMDSAANLGVTGSYSAGFGWSHQLAKPDLGTLSFSVGVLPVHIGFNMPIHVGIDVGATAQVSLGLQGASSQIHGSFDYTCSTSGCSGSSNFNSNGTGIPLSPTAGISGRVDARVWAQAAIRAYLYTEDIAYIQVGVRPTLIGDLWGYYGNTCGDADGNGINETVGALSFGLGWQGFLTAKASVLGDTVYSNNDVAHTSRFHLGFWDLYPGGSTAMAPMFKGQGSLSPGQAGSYHVQMRPCWPYGDNVSYQVMWGDGASQTFAGAPQTPVSLPKSYPASGTYAASAKALADAGGRNLQRSTARSIQVGGSGGTGGGSCDPATDPGAGLLPGQCARAAVK